MPYSSQGVFRPPLRLGWDIVGTERGVRESSFTWGRIVPVVVVASCATGVGFVARQPRTLPIRVCRVVASYATWSSQSRGNLERYRVVVVVMASPPPGRARINLRAEVTRLCRKEPAHGRREERVAFERRCKRVSDDASRA